jgi:hypothetical protein
MTAMTTDGDLLDDIRALRGRITHDRRVSEASWRTIDAAFEGVTASEARRVDRTQELALRPVAFALGVALLLFIVIACSNVIHGDWTHPVNIVAGTLGVLVVTSSWRSAVGDVRRSSERRRR